MEANRKPDLEKSKSKCSDFPAVQSTIFSYRISNLRIRERAEVKKKHTSISFISCPHFHRFISFALFIDFVCVHGVPFLVPAPVPSNAWRSSSPLRPLCTSFHLVRCARFNFAPCNFSSSYRKCVRDRTRQWMFFDIFFSLQFFFFCFFTIFRCSEHFHMFNEFVSARVYMLSSLDLCRYDAFCCLSKWGIFGMTWLLVAFFFFLFLYTCASSSASLVESAAAAASNPPARNKWDRENASSILSVVVMYIWILEFGYISTLHGGDGREYVWACLYCLENNRWHWHSVLVTMRCQNKF